MTRPAHPVPQAVWLLLAYTVLLIQSPFWLLAALYAGLVGRLPRPVTKWLLYRHRRYTGSRVPDLAIGPSGDRYLKRWWRIARNAWFNNYWHIICRSDDDRALHDHPWINLSIVLEGGYWEHTIAAGGIHHKVFRAPGSVRLRWAGKIAHRLELAGYPARTIFFTGPIVRRWGFHHPECWVDAYEWDAFCEQRGLPGRPETEPKTHRHVLPGKAGRDPNGEET